MLKGIRVIEIKSDLQKVAFQDDVAYAAEIKTASKAGDSYTESKEHVSIFFDLILEFVKINGEENQEAEVIGQSTIRSQCLFLNTKEQNEEWSEAELSEFAQKSIPEIYPHIYQKLKQVFNVHEASMPPLPYTFDPESFSNISAG